jgi:Ala-tRNA(Pro) deacylase
MLADKAKLAQLLAQLGINYDVIEHPALHTSLDADAFMVERPGTRLKNLFLRDNEGKKTLFSNYRTRQTARFKNPI